MAAGRLQRWANYLACYDFNIEYINGESNVDADLLSWLPTSNDSFTEAEQKRHMSSTNIEKFSSINRESICRESARDSTIATVIEYLRIGWPTAKINNELIKPFESRTNELIVENDILMWRHRVVIPTSLRNDFLSEVHASHSGTAKMKSKARSYFWWPKLDQDIEAITNKCQQVHKCIQARPNPPKPTSSPWPPSNLVFQRVHIDFLEPLANKFFFIVLDSYSKWIEVFAMNSTTSTTTIDKLRECFTRFGLPGTIVSDNGHQFTSNEFGQFCLKNGTKHLTTAPHHPQSNGAAENAIRTFKNGMKKALIDSRNSNNRVTSLMNYFIKVQIGKITLRIP